MVSMKALSLLVAEPQDWMLTKITMDLKSDDGTATVSQEIYPAKILTAQAPPKMGG